MSQEVKVYILEIGHVEKTSIHGHDTRVTQHDVVMKSDFDRVSKELEECKRWRDEAKNWNKVLSKEVLDLQAKLKIARDALEKYESCICDDGETYAAREALEKVESIK